MSVTYLKITWNKDTQKAIEKINAATISELEKWGLEFIDAENLKDIFQ